jgi:hypothetical protein
MADKRISQLVDRGTVVNNDVLPIVVSGATTTNKATISSIQTFMQANLDVGVTSVGITIGSTGTDINVTGSPVTSSGNITINIPTASATNRGLLSSANWTTFNNKVSSVGLSMPSAFTVANSPITGSGTIAVTGAGTVSQYVRGDGSLADFPQGGGGGGASVSYYLNGSVSQGTIGGIAYREMNKTPILGVGTDFTIAADGYIASFITDAGDPGLLEIPAGNWNFETYFQASSAGGSPTFYVELYKMNSGGTATLIASSSANPELIAFGTSTTPYFSALAVPTTVLTITDRLAIRYYVVHSGRTITLHTENGNLCQINTTFTTGLTALNGLTAQVQNFATGTSGTDFNISSASTTHTFNIPSASATNRGLVTTGSQTFAGAKTFSSDLIVNGITVGKGASSNVNNTAVGIGALSANTTGSSNTATGLSALLVNTGGNGNTANGYLSLQANTTGGYNASVGNQSMYSNSTGSNNTAVGDNSLYSNTTGGKNTGIGAAAGYYIADGSTPNTTSDFSIYLGADTKASVDNAQNETVIGYNAIGSGSNTVTIGNSSVTDNYFTGTIRSTSLRLAAAGTADPTFFRNTSGTSSSTGNANVLGFNSVNNIYLTTHSRGGFVLDFNNSVSNRTYTLQDASGTLAFTSQIPTVAGVYLPLAGGTLTGALNGTSASFNTTNAITLTASDSRIRGGDTTGRMLLANSGTTTYGIFHGSSHATLPNAIQFYNDNTLSLSLSSTGAATFSSSVNLGANANAADTALLNIKQAGTSYNQGIYIERGGERNGYHMYIGGALDSLTFRRNYFGTQSDVMSLTRDGNVGINTGSPSGKFEIASSANTYPSAPAITFTDTAGDANSNRWIVGNIATDYGSFNIASAPTSSSTSFTPRITINRLGNVGIGTASPSVKLQVEVDSASEVDVARFRTVNGADNQFLDISVDNTNNFVAYDASGSVGGDHIFRRGGSEIIRITGSGITFNGDTAAANALDDYEEGTWTPELIGGGGTASYSNRYGWYTKVGRKVTIVWGIEFQKNAIVSTLGMSGLPFTVLTNSPAAFYPQGTVLLDNLLVATNNITFQAANGSTQGDFIGGNGGTASHTGLSAASLGLGTMTTRGTITYFTN